jgi:hypothetical protein
MRKNLDQKIIFALLALVMVFGFFFSHPLHIAIEPPVLAAYNTIGQLKPGDVVVMSMDYGPSTMPEVSPAAYAMLRQLFQEKVKVIFMTLWNEGLPMIDDAIQKVCIPMGEKENVDYVNLGYKYGGLTSSVVMDEMGTNLKGVFPVTIDGIPYNNIPFLKKIHSLKDVSLLIDISAGSPGSIEYVQYVQAKYHIPIVAAVSKVMTPQNYPFYNAHQLLGLCSGIMGGAEYEELVHHPGFGMTALFIQSLAHLLIVFLILEGNILYFFFRKKEKG